MAIWHALVFLILKLLRSSLTLAYFSQDNVSYFCIKYQVLKYHKSSLKFWKNSPLPKFWIFWCNLTFSLVWKWNFVQWSSCIFFSGLRKTSWSTQVRGLKGSLKVTFLTQIPSKCTLQIMTSNISQKKSTWSLQRDVMIVLEERSIFNAGHILALFWWYWVIARWYFGDTWW